MNLEKPSAKDFKFEVLPSDLERGHAFIRYNGQIFKWFLREDGRALILKDGDIRGMSAEALQAMKEEAFGILRPALKSHNLKSFRP